MSRFEAGIALRWLESLWMDVRLGLRSLLRSPGTTVAALLALALGIGANAALFSVARATLWRELPVREPERLVVIQQEVPRFKWPVGATDRFFQASQRRSRSFEGLASLSPGRTNITGPGRPELVQQAWVSAGFFTVAGAKMAVGREFRAEEIRRKERVAIVSLQVFAERYGGEAERLKQGIVLDGVRYAVVGVAPPGLDLFGRWQVWLPDVFRPADRLPLHYRQVLGRLRPGLTLEQADGELETVSRALVKVEPMAYQGRTVRVTPLFLSSQEARRSLRSMTLLGLFAAFVLLIACADVAGLLLVRAMSREREIAVRAALGADRKRIARRMLVESLLLFLAGALAGVPLAFWGTLGLATFGPWDLGRAPSGPDPGILLVSVGLGLATGVVFGLVPAVSVSGRRLTESLKDTRRFVSRWGSGGVRNLLVAGQVALTVALIAGAGLLMRSFDRLQRVDPGIRPEGVLIADLEFPEERYADPHARADIYDRVLDSVRRNRGIEAAALVDAPPFRPARTFPFRVEGRPEPPAGHPVFLISRSVSPEYFTVLGIPLVRGRLFSGSDRPGLPRVAIVSETMAARHWPGQDPVGRRFRMGYDRHRPWLTIVGVVKDTRQRWLDTPFIEVYQPLSQVPWESVSLLVRAPGGPLRWTAPLSRALRDADPLLAGGSPRSLERIVAGELAGTRFQSRMILLFAILALILAGVGIYGVVNHSVTRRTHEIGIRIALGAQPGDVLRRVLLQGMAPVMAGIVLGLGAARLLGGLLADQLYEVRPGDPLTFTLAVVVIVSAGLVATYLPAQRATQVDPMAALREE